MLHVVNLVAKEVNDLSAIVAKGVRFLNSPVAQARPSFSPNIPSGAILQGCWSKRQHEHDQRADCEDAAASGDIWIAGNSRMLNGQGKKHGPDEPAHPKILSKRHE